MDFEKTYFSLRKIPKFHLISWCRKFVETRSFRRVLGDEICQITLSEN